MNYNNIMIDRADSCEVVNGKITKINCIFKEGEKVLRGSLELTEPSKYTIAIHDELINNYKGDKMKYQIVDKKETFNAYLNDEIEEGEVYVINFSDDSIYGLPEICAADIKNEDIIFMRRYDTK